MINLILGFAALFVVLLMAMMFRRSLLIAFFHFGGCLVCITWMLRISNPGSPVSQTLGFVLSVLATLPFGWTISFFRVSGGTSHVILLFNSLAWAGLAEWLLRSFVDQRRSPDAE